MRRRSYAEAERHGRRAERLCMLMLRLKAYRILAHHWRCPAGELDIVARRGRTLAVIEVKARADYATAAESVSMRQQSRIAMATRQFIAARPNLAALDVRFDVMLVMPYRLPRHLESAWLPA
ncbi:MAG TPA: YraN family protein [Aliidongia sp.]|nr:YraN family protein [Aliidongia sp.]